MHVSPRRRRRPSGPRGAPGARHGAQTGASKFVQTHAERTWGHARPCQACDHAPGLRVHAPCPRFLPLRLRARPPALALHLVKRPKSAPRSAMAKRAQTRSNAAQSRACRARGTRASTSVRTCRRRKSRGARALADRAPAAPAPPAPAAAAAVSTNPSKILRHAKK